MKKLSLFDRLKFYKYITSVVWVLVFKGINMDKLVEVLKSKRFLLAVANVITILVSGTLGLSEDQVMYITAIILSLIVGESLTEEPVPRTLSNSITGSLLALLKSERFWYAVAGVVAIAASEAFGLDEKYVLSIAGTVISLILGKSIRPSGLERRLK